MRRAFASAFLCAVLAMQVSAETIVLRGGAVLTEPVLALDLGGVHLGGEAPRSLGWDAVREVIGATAEEAARFAELSEQAWRARVRLDRGDVALATPLFRSLYAQCAGHIGPTPLLAAEGAARCELASGSTTAAVKPWLDAVRLRRLGARLAGEQEAGVREAWVARKALVDAETQLVEALPPIWLDGPEVDGLALALEDEGLSASDTATAEDRLRRWYAMAAAWESRREVDHEALTALAQRSLAPEASLGERLVGAIVAARAGDPTLRAQARALLEAIVAENMGTWREAWARVGLGRSLLLETDEAAQERALIHLLHAPARFESSLPGLSAIALAHAGVAVARSGRADAAQNLRTELASLATYHGGAASALAWLDATIGSMTPIEERP